MEHNRDLVFRSGRSDHFYGQKQIELAIPQQRPYMAHIYMQMYNTDVDQLKMDLTDPAQLWAVVE